MKAYCIYGPPGTGKTTELVRLVNELAERNPGARMAFLSHTRVAAREAVRRGRCSLPANDAMTLHSLCFRVCNLTRSQVVTTDRLVKFGEECGMPISGNTPDSERELTEADFMMAIYDLARARVQDPLEAYEASDRPGTPNDFRYLIRSYESWKLGQGLIDFTDMLAQALQSKAELPYKAFFVDEAQDLSALQRAVFYHFVRDAALVFMAGDDDQAIFEWAGADPAGMPEFEERFYAQRKVLSQSHRVPRVVHELAHTVISQIPRRVQKVYAPRPEAGVLDRVASLDELVHDHPMTLLYRDRSVRAAMEEHLAAELVPYRTTVGWPSPLQSRAGAALLMLRDAFRGVEIEPQRRRGLEDRLTERGKLALQAGVALDTKFQWSDYVNIPWRSEHYLNHVNLDAPEVTLSSIHSYKGAEADHVVLSNGMSARTYRNLSEKPEEEHRIYYVGVTRAKHRLTIAEGGNAYAI